MTRHAFFGLAAGTLAGGFARHALAGAVSSAAGRGFPWGVLVVNLLGCLAAGALEGLSGRLSPEARLALLTGFCGAFTTFSALMLDAAGLLKSGQGGRAFAYVVVSAAAGLACVRLGAQLASRF